MVRDTNFESEYTDLNLPSCLAQLPLKEVSHLPLRDHPRNQLHNEP
jgi:hypothetical protein